MVAGSPLFGAVDGSRLDAVVEAAGGEHVVELVLSSLWGPASGVVGGHVAGVGRQALRGGVCLFAVWVLGAEKLHSERGHSLNTVRSLAASDWGSSGAQS